MADTLINKVANSGLITLNLEEHYPQADMMTFDLKDYLFKELILKEKDFRAALKTIDWTQYQDKILLVYCSTDAIIPIWAYMLVSAYSAPYALDIFQGTKDEFLKKHYELALASINANEYEGKRIVIKGCSDKDVPPSAYVALTQKLQPLAQSIMFGEPCSTVPIFKRPRKLD